MDMNETKQFIETISQLSREIARMREALNFYADPLRYSVNGSIRQDRGRTAREALAQKEGDPSQV